MFEDHNYYKRRAICAQEEAERDFNKSDHENASLQYACARHFLMVLLGYDYEVALVESGYEHEIDIFNDYNKIWLRRFD